MFGFIVGVASLIGLSALRRRHGGHGCWHGHHHHHHHRHGHGHYGRHRRPLWRLFEHLDTTPGQEKLIRDEIGELWERAHDLERHGRQVAEELAEALRAETLEQATAEQILARHEGVLGELRGQAAGAVARIHEALDPGQRERLARFLSRRRWGGPIAGGPYRGGGWL
ncbi:hypothetical protein [Haliangium sp.]|uniref:hypothetical protein n=1 Tax=Haliangium sp. TaxID=2663208 RepID=UPI003D137B8C